MEVMEKLLQHGATVDLITKKVLWDWLLLQGVQ